MKKEFKSESKELLELMIHSIYSNKDIFLRELISNASDAIDKEHFLRIKNESERTDDLQIQVDINKKERKIIIKDTGIGMDKNDLENNLGTIAHSGSKEFVKEFLEEKEKGVDIIGQFGVGFYSSFIVSDDVEVISKKEKNAYKWTSDGVDSYEIEKSELDFIGTQVTITIKKGKDFNKYLEETEIRDLITTHSNYVRYPILMEAKIEQDKDGKDIIPSEKYETVNSQIAIWKKAKKDVKKEEYTEFYNTTYFDFTEPLSVVHSKSEGIMNMDMLLFIPQKKSFDYMSPTFKKGLDLYSRGVLIDNFVEYLLPDYFNFVRGVIDSEDLSLNVSREMLQQDKLVEKIKKGVETKVKKELLKLQNKKRDEYEKFYEEFGRTLMFGVYDNHGSNKDKLVDLLMFKSSKESKYVTLKEYLENNPENEFIYYVAGKDISSINAMPVMEKVKGKDIEILYLTQDVDEFGIQILEGYEGKEFKSILTADLDSDEEKEEIEKLKEESTEVLTKIKESLEGKVIDVRLTNKLDKSAVCLVNDNDISIEQEKILSQIPDNNFTANKILEINPKHEIFSKLSTTSNIEDIAKLLYTEARIIEGLSIEDPQEYADLVNKLILNSK